jgi:hypothetical protein
MLQNDKVFIDPTKFTADDFPIIVLKDDLRTFLGWGIKDRTSGNYCHSEILWKPNELVSQGWLFGTLPLSNEMKSSNMLKFWRIKNLTKDEKLSIMIAIQNRLNRPLWQRSYDFIGTFIGQLTGIRWLRIPGLDYCSEQVNTDYISIIPRAKGTVRSLPNPVDIDTGCNANLDIWECLGYWWAD